MSTSEYTRRPKYNQKHKMGTMGILRRGNKVLIIHRRLKTPEIRENGPPDTWSFPGGDVDADETPEEAVVREMFEEVGLEVDIVPMGDEAVWGQTDDFLDVPWRCFMFCLKQRDPSKEPEVKEPNKHVALRWVEWTALWEMIGADAAREEPGAAEGTMRFFPTMHNMVQKYPRRVDPTCLARST